MVDGRFTVQVVDDSFLFRQRVISLLNERNLHPVLQAGNYDEAVNWLLWTKVNMPGKSGIELLKLIRSRYPGTKVWMISNNSDEYYKQVCLSSGADHFFDKSHDFIELENKTTMICEEMQNQN